MQPTTRTVSQQKSKIPVMVFSAFFLCTAVANEPSPAPAPVDAPTTPLGHPAPSYSRPLPSFTPSRPPPAVNLSSALPGAVNESNPWRPVGAAPITDGQVENIPGGEVSGAVHIVLPHPTNADILYIGAVNGGIWKTSNATATSPAWEPLTDFAESLSIAALEFDPTDPSYSTIWAAVGTNSSFASFGGARSGLLRTTNAGVTWAMIDGGGVLDGKDITGVVARGNTVVISVDVADEVTFGNIGIFRSTNGGLTFSQVSNGNGNSTGLPGGSSFDLASHPDDPTVIYTNIKFADLIGGANGIYKSTDTGATWSLAGSSEMNRLVDSTNTSNVEISIHRSPGINVVYVGILNFGQLINGGVFRTEDAGASWIKMDNPVTAEVGGTGEGVVGTNPRFKPNAGDPGSQGAIHFSILADPTDPDVVYIGGDRQPRGLNDTGSWPNSIGASNFTGRLFRGHADIAAANDPNIAPSPQWKHLTHIQNAGGMIGGGTASNSAPHADSRSMAFDALGNLIQSDDGGVYKRTNPRDNTGDWFSLNGNLQISEMHDIAYDTLSNIYFSGNQDTGTPEQAAPGDSSWFSVSTADGGDVAVDKGDIPGQSVRYSSFQNLGFFRRRVFDENNTLLSVDFPSLTPLSFTPPINPTFRTSIAVNEGAPGRLVFLGANGVFESFDRGDTIKLIPSESTANILIFQSAIAYGNLSNNDALYVGRSGTLTKRAVAGQNLTLVLNIPGGVINDVVMDPLNWQSVWVAGDSNSFPSILHSSDEGANWQNITGNYPDRDARTLVRAPCDDSGAPCIYVAGATGVYQRPIDLSQGWTDVSSGLPNAPVFDLIYDVEDDLLVAGTMGRGAWVQQLTNQRLAMTESLGGFSFMRSNTNNGAIRGTLSINFNFLYSGAGVPLQDLYIQVTKSKSSFLQNPDGTAPGRVFSTITIPNDNLPGNNSFSNGETLTVPFEIGIVDFPWGLDFRLYGKDIISSRNRSENENKLLSSFNINSSMIPVSDGALLATSSVEPTIQANESPRITGRSEYSAGCTISSKTRAADPTFVFIVCVSFVCYIWRRRSKRSKQL